MSELENRKKGYQITIITLMIIIIALLLSLIVLFATGKAVRTVTNTPPESKPSSSSIPVSSSSEPEPSSSSAPSSSSSEPEPSSSSEPPPSSSVAPPPPPPPVYVPPVYVPPAPVAPPPPPPVAPIVQPTVLDISQTGSYEDNGVYESGVIRTSGVVLKNKTINGDLVITSDIGKRGVVTLENVIVSGELYVYAGSSGDGIRMKDCSINGITVENADDMIGLRASGRTEIGLLTLKSDVYLDEDNLNYRYYGFSRVNIKAGVPVWYDIDVGNARLDEMTIGAPSRVHISSDGRIKEVYANDSLKLSGYGSVATLRVKADNITYETKPGEIINPRGAYQDPSYSAD